MRAPGTALDADTRARYERHFGRDFSRIRVHADAEGAAAARSVAADAFTVGRHVVFARDRYAPHTGGGRDLLAHELAHAVQQGQAEAADPAGLSVSPPGDAAERAADRAAAGLAPAGRANAAIQRQPQPQPNVGPPVSEVPRPPICSVVFEGGKWFWKCENLPKIGSTPKIPLDPRDIPEEIRKIWEKAQQGGAPGPGPGPTPGPGPGPGPGPITPDDSGKLVEEICKRFSFICQPAPKTSPLPLPPAIQLGVLWTNEIHFEKDHPAPGERDAGRILTAGGQKELESVLSWLDISADLQVRLIGNASSEGPVEYNRALATRRVNFVSTALAGRGFGARVTDPFFSDGAESGCQRVGGGLWSCGRTRRTRARLGRRTEWCGSLSRGTICRR